MRPPCSGQGNRRPRSPVSQPVLCQVSAGFAGRRTVPVSVGRAQGRQGRGSRDPDANNRSSSGSTGCPQGCSLRPSGSREVGSGAGLTPPPRTAYRWAVEPVSTGAACPRTYFYPPWAGGASRTGTAVRTTPVRDQAPPIPDTGEHPREQAYVPAEQPPPSQDARFPSADAYPRRPRHLGVASSQGPQPPGCLSAVPALTIRRPAAESSC